MFLDKAFNNLACKSRRKIVAMRFIMLLRVVLKFCLDFVKKAKI